MKKIVPLIILLVVSWLFFNAVFFLGTHPTALIDRFFQWLFMLVWENVEHTILKDFLVFGFLTSLGGFLVYVPNIMLLFLFSHFLFSTGLSSRAARMVDPFFRLFGLTGYSFAPLLFGFGCSVNALHSAGTIENKKSRLLTMLIAPFMSCGAKFGVYILLISIIFEKRYAGTVLFCLYLLGIFCALVSTIFFRKLLGIQKNEVSEELPEEPLKKPHYPTVLKKTMVDGWVFLKKAGTVIVVASMIIWAFSYWPGIAPEKYDAMRQEAKETGQVLPSRPTLAFHNSYAARFGQLVEPLFRPIGQNWKNSIAVVSSVVGRGVIISSLITIYGIEYTPQGVKTLAVALQSDPSFSVLSTVVLMVFVLLCGGCLASVAMFYHDTKSLPLTALYVGYPIVIAWIMSFFFYQGGRLIFG